MVKKYSYSALEKLGRERLSENFYMRDFLYSEIAIAYGIQNVPVNKDLALEAGTALCEIILEPLHATFGNVVVRSAYRSPAVNEVGNLKGHNCASNQRNYAHHIWDMRDSDGCLGATACVFLPWFTERFKNGANWQSLAYWIHDNLPYSSLKFFDGKRLCSFNINWHEKPRKRITSWMDPRTLLKGGEEDQDYSKHYEGFPTLVGYQAS